MLVGHMNIAAAGIGLPQLDSALGTPGRPSCPAHGRHAIRSPSGLARVWGGEVVYRSPARLVPYTGPVSPTASGA